jgi:hypothetical protein
MHIESSTIGIHEGDLASRNVALAQTYMLYSTEPPHSSHTTSQTLRVAEGDLSCKEVQHVLATFGIRSNGSEMVHPPGHSLTSRSLLLGETLEIRDNVRMCISASWSSGPRCVVSRSLKHTLVGLTWQLHTATYPTATCLLLKTIKFTPQKIVILRNIVKLFVDHFRLKSIAPSGHETSPHTSRGRWTTQRHMTTPRPHHPRQTTFDHKSHENPAMLEDCQLLTFRASLLPTRTPHDQQTTSCHEIACAMEVESLADTRLETPLQYLHNARNIYKIVSLVGCP